MLHQNPEGTSSGLLDPCPSFLPLTGAGCESLGGPPSQICPSPESRRARDGPDPDGDRRSVPTVNTPRGVRPPEGSFIRTTEEEGVDAGGDRGRRPVESWTRDVPGTLLGSWGLRHRSNLLRVPGNPQDPGGVTPEHPSTGQEWEVRGRDRTGSSKGVPIPTPHVTVCFGPSARDDSGGDGPGSVGRRDTRVPLVRSSRWDKCPQGPVATR